MNNKQTIQKTPRAAVSFALACLLACGGASVALADGAEETMGTSEVSASVTTDGQNAATVGEQPSSTSNSQAKGDTTTNVASSGNGEYVDTTSAPAAASEGKTASAPATEGEMGVQTEDDSDGLAAGAATVAVVEELSAQADSSIVSGTWGTCAWEIDADGVLTVYPGNGGEKIAATDYITRGQVASILWSMAGVPAPNGMPKLFPDVTAGKIYYDAVGWASSVGVVNGYKSGRFGPEDLVTREQLAAMFANYASKVAEMDTFGTADDYSGLRDASKVSPWAQRSVGWCFYNRILSGTKDGLVDPQGNATWAETAKMLVLLHNML